MGKKTTRFVTGLVIALAVILDAYRERLLRVIR
jgi:hypothetical protein